MQRQELDQDALDFVARQRDYHRAQADRGDDDYLPAADRRNRDDVLGPYSRVRENDDVLHNEKVVRVIGAARGEGWFYALVETPFGWADIPYDGQYITDRAPADESEDALPIFLPKPEPKPRDPDAPPAGARDEGSEP